MAAIPEPPWRKSPSTWYGCACYQVWWIFSQKLYPVIHKKLWACHVSSYGKLLGLDVGAVTFAIAGACNCELNWDSVTSIAIDDWEHQDCPRSAHGFSIGWKTFTVVGSWFGLWMMWQTSMRRSVGGPRIAFGWCCYCACTLTHCCIEN